MCTCCTGSDIEGKNVSRSEKWVKLYTTFRLTFSFKNKTFLNVLLNRCNYINIAFDVWNNVFVEYQWLVGDTMRFISNSLGLEAEGLYRIAGLHDEVESIRMAFDKGKILFVNQS